MTDSEDMDRRVALWSSFCLVGISVLFFIGLFYPNLFVDKIHAYLTGALGSFAFLSVYINFREYRGGVDE